MIASILWGLGGVVVGLFIGVNIGYVAGRVNERLRWTDRPPHEQRQSRCEEV